VWIRDKAQQSDGERPRGASRAAAWLRRIAGRDGAQPHQEPSEPAPALDLLPHLLDGSPLPNGVVELVIENPRLSTRRVFDVHDGEIVPVEAGSTVPWTSIRGNSGAWAAALGCARDVSQLHHTGEPELAEKILGALEGRRLRPPLEARRYSVLDCS
jgi:hypothetical protein